MQQIQTLYILEAEMSCVHPALCTGVTVMRLEGFLLQRKDPDPSSEEAEG